MKLSRLPATPMETLSLSGAVAVIVKALHKAADTFGFWNHPAKKTAGDFEEMSLMDKIYWGYKSKNPIKKVEKDRQLEEHFKKSSAPIQVPEGFDAHRQLTFAAVGDVIKVAGLEHSKDFLYEDMAELIVDKDISYANFESQLTSQDLGAYVFSDKETPPLCCSSAQYEAIKGHKNKQYTIMHTACNHTFDMGLEGIETTLAQLEQDGIVDLGTNREAAMQRRARVLVKNGVKLGFVSATFGLNGKEVPKDKEYMVNVVKFHRKDTIDNIDGVDISLLENQIDDCRAQGCDIIFASLHWGYEYEFFPRGHQVEMAHKLVEMGVDVIVGHHSHVLQPVEYYHPKRDSEQTAVIVYSLGNLTSSYSAAHLVLSGILNITIAKGNVQGIEKTLVTEAKVIPVVQVEETEEGLDKIRIKRLENFVDDNETSENPDLRAYVASIKEYASLVI
jgi:poly-gamma-glutamate capsule biosynthesis protein CapA/YwtB (metallophosphatase superfamily)